MTEIFEKWVEELTGEVNSFDVSEAHSWLRAFVGEVEKRASDCILTGCDHSSQTMCRGKQLRKIVREFGLDGEGK